MYTAVFFNTCTWFLSYDNEHIEKYVKFFRMGGVVRRRWIRLWLDIIWQYHECWQNAKACSFHTIVAQLHKVSP